MLRKTKDILPWLARRGGPVVNLIWLATIALAVPALWPMLELDPWVAAAGLAGLSFPALAGLALGGRLDHPFERFLITLSWIALAAAICVSGGGLTGSGVLAFLLPGAVAAASGSRKAIAEAGLFSLIAAAVIGGLQVAGFIAAAPGAAQLHTPFMLGGVLIIAYGFTCASLRGLGRADAAASEAERGRIRSRAFDAAPAALIACDEDGKVLAASDGLRQLSPGLPRDVSDLPAGELGFDDPDRAELARSLRRSARQTIEDSVNLRGARGREIAAQMKATPIEGGSVTHFSMESDSRYTAEIEAARADAAQAREDALAKSQYLASISHELRTPLNAIIGFSDVMKARLFGPMPGRYAEYADLIHESGQHLIELIGDVLDMSKIEAERYELVLEEFDVTDTVELTAKMMRLQAEERGLALSVDPFDGPIQISADRKAVRQILLNLLSNAVKFTPDGGAVVVMARALGNNLVLAVGDSGVGLEPDEAARLGQPYQQADTARDIETRGTGLGLSLVRALADLHGGTMAVASKKGVGTTVTVTLPVLVESLGEVGHHPQLDVHAQIERAQEASEQFNLSSGAA